METATELPMLFPKKQTSPGPTAPRTPAPSSTAFSFPWKPAVPLRKIASQMSRMGFSAIRLSNSNITLSLASSHPHHGAPPDLLSLQLTPTTIKLAYPRTPSHPFAKLEACSILLEAMSLGGSGTYISPEFLSFARASLADAEALLTEDIRSISSKHSMLSEENTRLRSQLSQLKSALEKSESMLSASRRRAESLDSSLSLHKSLSDDSLCELLYDWLRSKGGIISLREFSNRYSIPVSRAEAGLAKLCKEGYIAPKK